MEKDRFKTEVKPDSFIVTLNSSSSHKYYPENTNNSFHTKLVNPISQSSHFEVGLVEAFYTPAADKTIPVFGHSKNDNRIQVNQKLKSAFMNTKREIEKIENFVFRMDLELKRLNINVQFHLIRKPNGQNKFILLQNERGRLISLTPEFAKAMGFTQKYYAEGRYEAENIYLQSVFDAIELTLVFTITIFIDQVHDVFVSEPSPPTAVHLISEINKSLKPHNISVIYDGENFEYSNEQGPGIETTFSPLIEKIFKIPAGHIFSKKFEVLPSYKNINLQTESQFVVFKCNIIQAQPYNGRLMPILKLFPKQKKINELVQVTCKPILYMPIPNDYKIENIKIELLDEFLNPLSLASESETTVVLHIKSRF